MAIMLEPLMRLEAMSIDSSGMLDGALLALMAKCMTSIATSTVD